MGTIRNAHMLVLQYKKYSSYYTENNMFLNLKKQILTLSRLRLIWITLLQIFSPYRAVNTLHLGYTNQSVTAVYGNTSRLF
jgi:hypothetical protein